MFDSMGDVERGTMLVDDHAERTAAYFATEREGDPVSAAARLGRESEYALYGAFAADGSSIEDFELCVASYRSASGRSKREVERGVLGYARLKDLPQLRRLQEETLRLDVSRLAAIDSALDLLGSRVTPEIFAEFDRALVRLFTPTKPAEELPSPTRVSHALRRRIAAIDPSVDCDPKKRRKRSFPDPTEDSATFFESVIDGVVQQGVEVLTNATTMALIRAQIEQTSREEKLSPTAAMIALLTGTAAPRKIVLNVYSPVKRHPGDPIYIPGFGWSDAPATAAFEELGDAIRVADLDAAATVATPSYTPTPLMRCFVNARDRTCVFPGCEQPAEQCQLDHRIPFDQGGATTADNLFALCQKHHNVKTDRRAFYVPDPATGDIIWLFADGTYAMSNNNGLFSEQITPVNPRWRSSLDSIRKNKARASQFYAKCHRVVDTFERDGDYAACSSALQKLEQEYGYTFDHYPPPPPPEPDDLEPPFPDPEDNAPPKVYSPLEQAILKFLSRAS